MKKLLSLLLFTGMCTGIYASNEWHGYVGFGGEFEQGVPHKVGDSGYGKLSPMIEFSTWNGKGFSLFGKVLNTIKTDKNLNRTGSEGHQIELWPTYTKQITNKFGTWIATPIKMEKYSDDKFGMKQSGYFSLGIAPGISYQITEKVSIWAKTYYKYDVETYSGVDKENYLESEFAISYKFNDKYKINVGSLYKKYEDKYAWWNNSRQEANITNTDELLAKTSLEINMPEYQFRLVPYLEIGGYYNNTEYFNGNKSVWDERDSYKIGLTYDKQLTQSWKLLGEIYWRKHFVDTEETQFDKETYYAKVILAYTF